MKTKEEIERKEFRKQLRIRQKAARTLFDLGNLQPNEEEIISFLNEPPSYKEKSRNLLEAIDRVRLKIDYYRLCGLSKGENAEKLKYHLNRRNSRPSRLEKMQEDIINRIDNFETTIKELDGFYGLNIWNPHRDLRRLIVEDFKTYAQTSIVKGSIVTPSRYVLTHESSWQYHGLKKTVEEEMKDFMYLIENTHKLGVLQKTNAKDFYMPQKQSKENFRSAYSEMRKRERKNG
jgi:hypothetical protein